MFNKLAASHFRCNSGLCYRSFQELKGSESYNIREHFLLPRIFYVKNLILPFSVTEFNDLVRNSVTDL